MISRTSVRRCSTCERVSARKSNSKDKRLEFPDCSSTRTTRANASCPTMSNIWGQTALDKHEQG